MFPICYFNCNSPQRVVKKRMKSRKVKKFIDKYNWCGIKYPPDLNDFRRFENKNKDVSLT